MLSYTTAARAYARDDNVLLYEASLTARAALRLRSSGRVVWRGESGWRETFPRFDDKALQRDAERTASLALVSRVAEELYARLAERF